MEHMDVQNKSTSNATEMLNTLLSIGAGEIIENTLHKVIHYQLAKYRTHIDRMNREMEPFEKSY
ncbi:MAG: hypothetical protein GY940_18060 [bacterium]|nr:hypothetical protein [bacterium]